MERPPIHAKKRLVSVLGFVLGEYTGQEIAMVPISVVACSRVAFRQGFNVLF